MRIRSLAPWLGLALVLALTVGGPAGPVGHARAATTFQIVPDNPGPNSTTNSATPTVSASFVDTAGTVALPSVVLIIDGENLIAAGVGGVNVTSTGVTYTPPSVLAFTNGLHNVTVSANDSTGASAIVTWSFTVNTNATTVANPFSGVRPATVLLYVAIGAAVTGAAVGIYILFLKQTARFTFRRYFANHPVERRYLVVYLPLAVAFVFALLALDWAYNTSGLPVNTPDYVIIATIFIAITPFGIDARHEMLRIRVYERAFAQLLFEMADAMRGGIDPAKAITELAKTHTNILRKPLRVAADAIRLGQPFDSVLRNMAKPMKSALITRYAGLIADATGYGGETSTVVYRAAKDMDDFVKIEEEREKQLLLPVAVVYIAFAVLMAVLFSLLYIGPSLGQLNIGFAGFGTPLSGGTSTSVVPKLSIPEMKERFFELMIINALGTGAIIGAFTEGRARYGILHSLGLVAATAIAFAILFP